MTLTIPAAPQASTRAARRTLALVPMALAALLALSLLLTPTVAVAAPDAGSIVLAVSGDPIGPTPMPRDAEDNPARELGGYEDREVPFTWGAAWLLAFLGFGGLATMGLVYWRAVDRPGRRATASR
jgi:hypothetical protein